MCRNSGNIDHFGWLYYLSISYWFYDKKYGVDQITPLDQFDAVTISVKSGETQCIKTVAINILINMTTQCTRTVRTA